MIIACIFFAGQFIEGNILSPNLVGSSVGLHPVWLMFALFAFGYLFGFVGMLVAVPLAAAVGVLVRFGLKSYLGSSFYLGKGPHQTSRGRFGLTLKRPHKADRERQIPMELPHQPAMGRDDFLIAESNRTAFDMIEAWPDWPASILFLVGPEGSGKSHLAAIWQSAAGANQASCAELTVESVPEMMEGGALLLDDCVASQHNERALFHLFNYVREQSGHVLLVSEKMPAYWTVSLPDLRSRLRAAPVITVDEPDDALLRAVLAKLFHDRQIAVDESVLAFMIVRMERSLRAASVLVEEIDKQALAAKAPVTRTFVSRLMSVMASGAENSD